MSADRMESNSLAVTHEVLGQVLGSRRSSASVCVERLAKTGLIASSRGGIKLIDRKGLKEAACECYGILQRQIDESS